MASPVRLSVASALDAARLDVGVDPVFYPGDVAVGDRRLNGEVVVKIRSQEAVSTGATLPRQGGQSAEWVLPLAGVSPESIQPRF